MLRLLSRGLLVAALGLGYVAHGVRPAYAQDDEDFGDDEGDDGSADDGSDSGDGGDEGDDGDDEEQEDAKDQPPVTAGGLFTLKTYPVREISRPLTMTKGIAQVRVAGGTDLSAKGAFESFGLSVEGQYGYQDNFTLLGGFTNAYNMKQFGVYFGFEGALAYDVVDIRLAANLHRNAIPQFGFFCNPPATPGEMPMDNGTCTNTDATIKALPNGKFSKGGTKFSIDVGFPFRYAIKPEIAIVALQTLMSIDFNSVKRDYATVVPFMDPVSGIKTQKVTLKGNGAKPDLNPSIGIATNPIPPLSIVLYAQLRIPDFDTEAGAFQVPVTGRIEFSPNQKFDVGLEFTLLNVKPPEGQSPIDNRYLALFAQSRFGK
jgi:hypothetical protein